MSFYNFTNNKRISKTLKKSINDILLTGNKFKARAYSKALESLEFNPKTETLATFLNGWPPKL